MRQEMMYDIDNYSDSEIYDLLDLVNPSDRVLEAKIIQMIQKYNAIENETSRSLTVFFQKIYDRFFFTEDQDDQTPEPTHAAYDTPLTQNTRRNGGAEGGTILTDRGNDMSSKRSMIEGLEGFVGNSNAQSVNTPAVVTEPPPQIISLTTTADYKRDNLNPLLKQTIKRIISIDSQYRDKKYTYATDFTFNLSEPLRDVVALRLYSVQIPYTWYTINNSYGGNYLYLKGNSAGIDNGKFDYKVEIVSGNYNPTDLVKTVNDTLQSMKTQYTDISFGTTSVTYNYANNLSTFNVDIKKIFHENDYEITFEKDPSLNSYPLSLDRNSTIRYDQTKPTSNLSAFLGFNYLNYTIQSVYSQRTLPMTTSNTANTDNTASLYTVNSSNNYFTIYQYKGPDPQSDYNPLNTIFNTTIKLSLPDGKHTRTEIVNDLSSALANTSFIYNSSIIRYDISYSLTDGSKNYIIENNGNSYYNLTINLQKSIHSNEEDIKTVIVFPTETDTDSRIWVKESNINNCCFYFTNRINELSIIKAESIAKQSSYIINTNPYIYFKCISPGYDTIYNGSSIYNPSSTDVSSVEYWRTHDFSFNDYKIDISNNELPGYKLTEYLDTLNNTMKGKNDSTLNNLFNINDTYFSENTQNKISLKIDINKVFNTSDYSVDFSGSILYDLLGLGALNSVTLPSTNLIVETSSVTTNGPYDLQIKATFESTISGLIDTYTIKKSKNILKIKPNGSNPGNKYASEWNIQSDLSVDVGYSNYIQFRDKINNIFTNFSDMPNSYPLSGSRLDIRVDNEKTITTLTLQINKILTENNYQLYFYDQSLNNLKSIIARNLGFDTSYNLSNYGSGKNYAEIIGSQELTSNNYYLDKQTYFTISPISNRKDIGNNLNGNIDPIKITITPRVDFSGNVCSLGQLINIINIQFENNPITRGSLIKDEKDIDGNNYVYIRFNINKIYSTNDFKVVFYDYTSFVKCYLGLLTVRNVTWDSTLGWILGFHANTEYPLSEYNTNNPDSPNVVSLIGDTTIITNLYNYFLIILDDYTQSHLNDGLVTVTQQETDIPLPSYASKTNFKCDANGNKVFDGVIDQSVSTENGLTQNQIYSANQIYLSQKTRIKSFSLGPFKQDIFGLIPIKVSGLANGSYYVEFGGTLQNQERIFFGPVNISRMSIKLINDKGELVDLNNSNWSFSFICEQLYQQNSV